MNEPGPSPRRAVILPRPRLRRLLAGRWKVAVLAAPAGFGKSTLAGQYAGRRLALWCRIDREDRDVAHLMGNLISAGLRLRPPIGTETRRLWEGRRDLERDGRFLTQSLLEELVPPRGERLVIFEDVHHLADAREALLWLRRLMEESGPRVRYLLTSRGESPVPLARFELHGGVVEIGADALELDPEEQLLLLRRVLGKRASREEADGLRQAIGGWPAGWSVLAGRPAPGAHLKPRAPAGEDERRRRLVAFLDEEIFAPWPAVLQRSLCQAALLDDLEPETLRRLLGPPAASRVLGAIARREVLLRGRSEGSVAPSFHPLLRGFLLAKWAEMFPAEERRRFGRRLARYRLRRGEEARAVRVLLEAEDVDEAVALFESIAGDPRRTAVQSGLVPVGHELLRHPRGEAVARRSPWVLFFAAHHELQRGRSDEAARLVRAAQEIWLSSGGFRELVRSLRVATTCAQIGSSYGPVLDFFEQVGRRIPARDRISQGILQAEIGNLRLYAGDPPGARRCLDLAARSLRGTPHELDLVEVEIHRANVLFAAGRWDEYLTIAQRALGLFRRMGYAARCQGLLINMADAWIYLGEEERALSLLEEAERLNPRAGGLYNEILIEVGRGRARSDRREWPAAAGRFAKARSLGEALDQVAWTLQIDVWEGVMERRRGRLREALRLLGRAEEALRTSASPSWHNLARMERALASGLAGETERATADLLEAARASARLGDAKEVARNLLYQARVLQCAGRAYDRELLRALRALEKERYFVGLRKEADVAAPLLETAASVPASLQAAALAFLPPAARTRSPAIASRGAPAAESGLLAGATAGRPASGGRRDRARPPAAIRIRLLGGFEVLVDGRPLSFPRRASLEIVARLALRPGEAIRRETLAESLWPGADPASSRNRFDVALNAARRALEPQAGPRGPFEVLSTESGWCRLAPRHVSVDVQEFEAAVRPLEAVLREALSGREGPSGAASRAEGSRAVERLRAAAGAYAGDLLPDLPDAEWTQRERDRLRERFHLVLLGLGALCLRCGEAEEAVGAARRILADDPLHEEACRILLEGLAARKDRAGVLRSYRAFARRSRRELGVPPGPEMVALVRRVLERPRSGFTGTRAARASARTG